MAVYRVGSNKSSGNNFPSVRPSLDLDFANSRTLDPRITFTRSSGGSYVGVDGLIKYAGVNVARFDHDPATGESLGLLIEESRTNYLQNTETFSGWSSINLRRTFDGSVINPSGTYGALKISDDEGSNDPGQKVIFYDANVGNNNQFFCHSFFVKPIGTNKNVQLNIHNFGFPDLNSSIGFFIDFDFTRKTFFPAIVQPGVTLLTYGAIKYPNGWYRIYAVANTTSQNSLGNILRFHIRILNSDGFGVYFPDGNPGLWIWGVQMELGTFPTSYIPTLGSTRTRASDVVYIPNVDKTDWYNKLEGTIEFEHTTTPVSPGAPLKFPAFGFGSSINGASTQSIQYSILNTSPNSYFLVRDFVKQGFNISADQVGVVLPTPSNTAAKVAFAYKVNDFGIARNGIFIGRDNKGIVPNDAYMLIIGQNNININEQVNAHCKYLRYYSKRLTDSQLQVLTK